MGSFRRIRRNDDATSATAECGPVFSGGILC